MTNGEMTFSQRLSAISLIHKIGEKNVLQNYRSISLTNTDYKIIAFIFAQCLQKIIHKQIGNEQTAYIKGRFIGTNARFILGILIIVKHTTKRAYYYF